jgi:hypothetical protein
MFTGEAESGLERLHQCAEKELQAYMPYSKPETIEDHPSATEFGDFRVKLVSLTRYCQLSYRISSCWIYFTLSQHMWLLSPRVLLYSADLSISLKV